MTIRIAMWSGPRNISTAMMRSWENRSDCSVIDEPFYAYYLSKTQSPHPMFDEIMDSQSSDYDVVSKQLSQTSAQTPIEYQKHMTHHLFEGDNLGWAKDLRHCFLIRDPAYVVNSYTNSRGVCSADDIGIIRQWQLYEELCKLSGQSIPVIDADSTLADPASTLRKLCLRLDIEFQSKMLSWPTGKRKSDGIWASHWYHSVESSTGFSRSEKREIKLDASQQAVVDEVMPYYLKLKSLSQRP